jgi:hypothetical protein
MVTNGVGTARHSINISILDQLLLTVTSKQNTLGKIPIFTIFSHGYSKMRIQWERAPTQTVRDARRLSSTPSISPWCHHYGGEERLLMVPTWLIALYQIVYGIQVLPTNDPYIKIAETSMGAAAAAGNPGTFLVDVIPMRLFSHSTAWIRLILHQ